MRDSEFRGTDRFQVLRRLGSGGMGVVYAAHDTHRDETVALKTLLFADGAAIYRLKREFRALADVTHPNLITLYELIADADDWFYTMELVEGRNFLEHVRPGGLDEWRLRSTVRQVAEGLIALHASGKLHRDLKPSNVLVTPRDRAVILDFGVATDIARAEGMTITAEHGVWGTPSYMSPEQAEGVAVEASDWYALGVMLYEALTGRLPFTGTFLGMLTAKLTTTPVRPDVLAPGLPGDLTALCRDLLHADPGRRVGGAELLGRLGVTPRATPGSAQRAIRTSVVGREDHLAALRAAASASRTGPVICLVSGPSGSGKTTLLDAFRARAAPGDTLILQGRCYVRESVPFKGLDSVLDSLSRWLIALPEERQASLLTPALAAGARLFPALARIPRLVSAVEAETGDPPQLRRSAVAALRGLLRAIAAAQPLALLIDDFQWGDRDGALLLEELIAEPDAPALLLVVAFRSDEISGSPVLAAFAVGARAAGAREIAVGPLSEADSRMLATSLLGANNPAGDAIVREAGGSPFLMELLAAHAKATHDDTEPRPVSVTAAQMLARRLAELPPGVEPLLETLAVAARPLSALVARDAAGLDDERRFTPALLAEHLLRPGASADQLELYHDRIREVIVARMPRERLVATHRRLADALEARGGADPETLYEHCAEAGDLVRAQRYAAAAADNAALALAFERAALLYRRALELRRAASGVTHALEVKLGDALANAGRGLDAAEVYLAAAERADDVAALELRRRAADQLLRCGHVERGFQVVDTVLRAVGERPSRAKPLALVRLLARRALVGLRGLDFTERAADAVPPATIRRLDVCWTVALGLVRVDNLRAADFQTHHLLLALRAGEPYRIARALACETAFVSLAGGPSRARSERLLVATQALAARTGNAHAIGIGWLAEAVVRHFLGEWAGSVPAADRAERILRERCTGVWWEIDSAQEYSMGSLYYLGDWAEVARRVPGRLREAEAHDDRYAAADLAAGRPNIVWLIRDDVAEARRMFGAFIAPWSGEAFHSPQWLSLYAESQIDFYDGNGAAAWPRMRARWKALRRSTLLRIQVPRLEAYDLRARCALAAALSAAPSERGALLASAAADARRVARERMPWANPLADLALAGVTAQQGDHPAAIARLRVALDGCRAAGLSAHAAAAGRRLGRLVGGDEGRALIAAADAWFAAVGGVRPDRLTAVIAPGFTD